MPEYRGSLKPASWSELPLTDELRKNLAAAAVPGCPECGGNGYLGEGPKVPICRCVELGRAGGQ